MARSYLNIRQLSIVSSSAAIDDGYTNAVDDNDLFVFQNRTTSGAKVKVVDAKTLQNYFSDVDIQSAGATDALSLVFTSASWGSDPGAPGSHTLYKDALTDISWTPGSNLLTINGDLFLDHDAAVLTFGDDGDVTLTHVDDTGLLLNGGNALQFRSSGASVSSSGANQLDLDATTTVQVVAPTVDVNASTKFDVDAAAVELHATDGTLTLDATGALTIGGASLDIDADGGSIVMDATSALDLGAGAASNITVTTGSFSIITDADVSSSITLRSDVTGSATAIHLDGNQGDDAVVDIDAGVLQVDSAGTQTFTAGGAFLVDGASTVGIQGASTISIGTADEGTAVNIGHGTSEVTIGDNLTVTGDFTVNGTTTTINSTVKTIDDPLIVLGKDNPGTARDLGIIFEQSGSSTNTGFFYDSSATEFAMKTGMTEDGTTAGNINASGSYAKLHVGEIDADGALDVAGATTLNGAVTIGDASGDNLIVNSADVDYANLGTLTNAQATGSGVDLIMVRDASAETAKHMTMASYGAFLSRGTSTTATDSNGVKVSSAGVLSVSLAEDFYTSSSATGGDGKTFTLASASTSIAVDVLDNSLQVYLNGQLQLKQDEISGNNGDYTTSGSTVVFHDGIDANDVVVVRYQLK